VKITRFLHVQPVVETRLEAGSRRGIRNRHLTHVCIIDDRTLYVLIRERRYRRDAFRAAIVDG
jgi:hypothetical protein